MESMAVRRRMNMIAGHLAGNEELSVAQLLPMNCSGSIHTVTPRHDNRTLFARQGSMSQACFMRQSLAELNLSQPTVPPTSKSPASKTSSGAALFSRPVGSETVPRTVEYRPAQQDCQMSLEEPPKFSRPYRGMNTQNQIIPKDVEPKGEGTGSKLPPRMDVAESERNYAIFLELPGVSIDNIRVEVDDRNLIVTGKHPTQCLVASSVSKDSLPYHIAWPLPNNVNKDRISAELLNGVLRITLPKY